MTSLASISLSGMQAAQNRLQAAASNIASDSVPGAQNLQAMQQALAGGGVESQLVARNSAPAAAGERLVNNLVEQLQAKHQFMANLAVFRSADSIAGALVDHYA